MSTTFDNKLKYFKMGAVPKLFGGFLQWFFRRIAKVYFRELTVMQYHSEGYTADHSNTTQSTDSFSAKRARFPGFPTLLIANHPNGLVDGLVVYATGQKPVRFVAKSTLWNIPLLRPFLYLSATIPIHRHEDRAEIDRGLRLGRSLRLTNEDLLAGIAYALQDHCFVIYPEGVSHDEPSLAKLKTGASRILITAAGAAAKTPEAYRFKPEEFGFMPAGLYFDQKTRFRSRALVYYGKPVQLKDVFDREELNQISDGALPELVKKLTAAMEESLRAVIPWAESENQRELGYLITQLLLEPNIRNKIGEVYSWDLTIQKIVNKFAKQFPESQEDITKDLRQYFAELEANNISDLTVRDYNLDPKGFFKTVIIKHVAFWLILPFLLPFIFTSVICFYPAYELTGHISQMSAEDRSVVSTWKILGGFVLFPITAILCALGVSLLFGVKVGLTSIAILWLGGVLTLIFGEYWKHRREEIRSLLRSKQRQELSRLGQLRTELLEKLEQAYEQLMRSGHQ